MEPSNATDPVKVAAGRKKGKLKQQTSRVIRLLVHPQCRPKSDLRAMARGRGQVLRS